MKNQKGRFEIKMMVLLQEDFWYIVEVAGNGDLDKRRCSKNGIAHQAISKPSIGADLRREPAILDPHAFQ